MSRQRSIFSQIKAGFSYLKTSGLESSEPFRLKTLNSLNEFVLDGSYTKYRSKDLFLQVESYPDKVIANQLSISIAGVRQARKRISEDAFKILGYDVVDKILYQDKHSCDLVNDNITLLSTSFGCNEFILSEVKERLENAYLGDGTKTYNLLECKNEMLFLSLFTVERFSHLVDKLDSEKINYLLRLIYGKETNTDDKFIALKYISNLKNNTELAKIL